MLLISSRRWDISDTVSRMKCYQKYCQNFNFSVVIKFFLGRERCFGNLKDNLQFNFYIHFETD